MDISQQKYLSKFIKFTFQKDPEAYADLSQYRGCQYRCLMYYSHESEVANKQ